MLSAEHKKEEKQAICPYCQSWMYKTVIERKKKAYFSFLILGAFFLWFSYLSGFDKLVFTILGAIGISLIGVHCFLYFIDNDVNVTLCRNCGFFFERGKEKK